MKLWYLLMHFDGQYVTGMMSVAETHQQAIKDCLKLLNSQIKTLRVNAEKSDYVKKDLQRIINFRRTLNNPHRYNNHLGRKEPILKIMEITGAFHTGYWIGLSDNHNFCNVTKEWEQDPVKGYYYSELKNEN